MVNLRTVTLVLVILFAAYVEVINGKMLFQFKRYHYKKKPRMENLFKRDSNRCQNTRACSSLGGLEQIKCTRLCVADECYDELYAWNELEEGEVDIRAQSFKGCWVKKVMNSRYSRT